MRSFDPEGPTVWPVFRWSKDDKYFAKIGNDILSIYETPVSIYILFYKVLIYFPNLLTADKYSANEIIFLSLVISFYVQL